MSKVTDFLVDLFRKWAGPLAMVLLSVLLLRVLFGVFE